MSTETSLCRKRPRSDSTLSTASRRLALHAVTPAQLSSDDSDSDLSAFEDDYDESEESEPEAETSIESPVSSPCSSSGLLTPPPLPHKRRRTVWSPASRDGETRTETTAVVEDTGASPVTRPLAVQRDEIVAAILTIASALGLTKETLHVCVGLLDRYLALSNETNAARLETLSIACLWLAVKFIETPETIIKKSIKQILKRRRHSGNWTWHEIIRQEAQILKVLNFRLMAPTVLSVLQAKLHTDGASLSSEQRQLAFYFADLLLLKDRANEFSKELLVDAIWFIITGHQIADVQAPLLAPVVILFLAHRDNINPQHAAYKTWFALRCQYGPSLQAPWQLPYDPKCECRVCEHTESLAATTPAASPSLETTPTASPHKVPSESPDTVATSQPTVPSSSCITAT